MIPKSLTFTELQELTGLSESEISHLERRGLIPPHIILPGGQVIWSLRAIKRWADQGPGTSRAEAALSIDDETGQVRVAGGEA